MAERKLHKEIRTISEISCGEILLRYESLYWFLDQPDNSPLHYAVFWSRGHAEQAAKLWDDSQAANQ